MNIIFLTLVRLSNIDERGIYHDLMRKFRDEGHEVILSIHAREDWNLKQVWWRIMECIF